MDAPLPGDSLKMTQETERQVISVACRLSLWAVVGVYSWFVTGDGSFGLWNRMLKIIIAATRLRLVMP